MHAPEKAFVELAFQRGAVSRAELERWRALARTQRDARPSLLAVQRGLLSPERFRELWRELGVARYYCPACEQSGEGPECPRCTAGDSTLKLRPGAAALPWVRTPLPERSGGRAPESDTDDLVLSFTGGAATVATPTGQASGFGLRASDQEGAGSPGGSPSPVPTARADGADEVVMSFGVGSGDTAATHAGTLAEQALLDDEFAGGHTARGRAVAHASGSQGAALDETLETMGFQALAAEAPRGRVDPDAARRMTLGALAVAEGLLAQADLDRAVALAESSDGPRRRLGQVLVGEGLLAPDQVRRLLALQGKQVLVCPACYLQANIEGLAPGQTVRCSCGEAMEVPAELDRVDVAGSLMLGPAATAGAADEVVLAFGAETVTRARRDVDDISDEEALSLDTRLGTAARSGTGMVVSAPEPKAPPPEAATAATLAPEAPAAPAELTEDDLAREAARLERHKLDMELKSATRRIADYHIVRELGRGAMGVVYLAIQEGIKRRVALKVLPQSITANREVVGRFQREAEAVGRLHHENITQVYGAGKDGDTYYYAMEFIEGKALDDVIKTERYPPEKAAAWVLQAARGLAFAHQKGIVHRDVKPANLMLCKDGRVVVADFGLAKQDDAAGLSAEGQILGTPAYMAPEQALGDREEVDGRSDTYSLAATLYELLTLERPFRGDDIPSVLAQVVNDEPKPLRRINEAVPADLETIVLKGMEKTKARRYESCTAFADDVQSFLGGEPIAARPVGTVEHVWRKVKKHPALCAAGAVAVLAVLALAGFFAWGAVQTAERRADAWGRWDRLVADDHWEEAAAHFQTSLTEWDGGSDRYLEVKGRLDGELRAFRTGAARARFERLRAEYEDRWRAAVQPLERTSDDALEAAAAATVADLEGAAGGWTAAGSLAGAAALAFDGEAAAETDRAQAEGRGPEVAALAGEEANRWRRRQADAAAAVALLGAETRRRQAQALAERARRTVEGLEQFDETGLSPDQRLAALARRIEAFTAAGELCEQALAQTPEDETLRRAKEESAAVLQRWLARQADVLGLKDRRAQAQQLVAQGQAALAEARRFREEGEAAFARLAGEGTERAGSPSASLRAGSRDGPGRGDRPVAPPNDPDARALREEAAAAFTAADEPRERAKTAFAQALGLWKEVSDPLPGAAQGEYEVLYEHAALLFDLGQLTDDAQHYGAAVYILESDVRRLPWLADAGAEGPGARARGEAAALLERIRADGLAVQRYEAKIAAFNGYRANLNWPDAEAALKEARAAVDARAAAGRTVADQRRQLTEKEHLLAIGLARTAARDDAALGRWDEADRRYREAAARAEALVGDFGAAFAGLQAEVLEDRARFAEKAAGAFLEQALALEARGRDHWEEALAGAERARAFGGDDDLRRRAEELTVRLFQRLAAPPGFVYVPASQARLRKWQDAGYVTVAVPAFYLAATEVTNAEFARFAAAASGNGYAHDRFWRKADGSIVPRDAFVPDEGSGARDQGQGEEPTPHSALRTPHSGRAPLGWTGGRFEPGTERHAVTGVSFWEASAYARWLTEQPAPAGFAFAPEFRLPTEDEWEKAAGWAEGQPATTMPRPYPFRETAFHLALGHWQTDRGADVPTKPETDVSAYGVYDMAGSAMEWTVAVSADGTVASLRGSGIGVRDAELVKRFALVETRRTPPPEFRARNTGFRLALSAPERPAAAGAATAEAPR